MELVLRKSLTITLFVSITLAVACSNSPKLESAPSFMGHAIGENSMTWALAEKLGLDPHSQCQEMLRSPLAEQSLPSTQKCREFVDQGTYLIEVRDDPKGAGEKVFRFANWRLSLMVFQLGNNERSHVIADFDSRFKNSNPGRAWHAKDGTVFELMPAQQLRLFVDTPGNPDGFLVVISDGGR